MSRNDNEESSSAALYCDFENLHAGQKKSATILIADFFVQPLKHGFVSWHCAKSVPYAPRKASLMGWPQQSPRSTRHDTAVAALLVISLALGGCDDEGAGSTSRRSVAGVAAPLAHGQPVPKEAAVDCSLVLYGDSILNGSYVAADLPMRHPRNPAVELKAQRPAWRIDDRTQPGQSLETLAKVFLEDPRASRVVVIESGIAEGWSGRSVMSNLPWMLEAVRYEGRTPVLTGYARQVPNSFITPDKMAGRDRVDAEAQDLARNRGVEFADFGAAGPVEIADNVHPTQAYSQRLTGKLVEALDRVAPECSH